jgi:hypothetical protein
LWRKAQEDTMSQAPFQTEYDNKGQYERIRAICLPDEVLLAVFDEKGRGTGFVGISNRRLIFMDVSPIRKHRLMISLPYAQITAVASEDTGNMPFAGSSKLTVIAGAREWDFEFHSNQKAHRAYQLIMHHVIGLGRAG